MDALKRWLEVNAVSQEAFAKRVGVTPGAVSQWLSGSIDPRPARLKVISTVTGLSIDVLLGAAKPTGSMKKYA